MVELFYLPLKVSDAEPTSRTKNTTTGFDQDLTLALSWLDSHETARYQRFKHLPSQQCYLQARRIAKEVLAEKLACQPQEISFTYNDTEKPFLANSDAWHFNISHCHSAVVVAIAPFEVGVDVENVSRCKQVISHAEDFLNPVSASHVVNAETEEDAANIFATHWCCTESYVKWLGSAIYREKDRVQARYEEDFSHGKRYGFDDCAFTVFEHLTDLRLAVAIAKPYRDIQLIEWPSRKQLLVVDAVS